MDPQQAAECAARLEVVADPSRLQILDALREGEMSVGQIAETVGEMPETVASHVQALHAAGFLEERHDGGYSRYSLPTGLVEDGRLVIDLSPLFRVMAKPTDGQWRKMMGGLRSSTADMLVETLREIMPGHEFAIERDGL